MAQCFIMVIRLLSLLLAFHGLLCADTILVTVGNTGCAGRQQAVKSQWERIPGVISVNIQPRQKKEPGAQRKFVIVTGGKSPTPDMLRTALGRRENQYPILDCRTVGDSFRFSR